MAIVGSNVDLKDIFEKERFPKSNWQYISLIVYFPFGLILAVLRFFIGLHACLVALLLTHTPFIRSIVLRMLCLVLGINVEQENKQERDKSTRVIVANCVTRFDYIAFHLTTDCISHSKWDGLFPVSLLPGLHDFTLDGNHNIVENLRSHIENNDTPVLLQPEETTSGKQYLLKFNTTPAEICDRVQPCAVIVERPIWANTAPTVLGSSSSTDLFWFLFSPYTVFKLRYLNVLHREGDETDEAFTERMSAVIASALTVKTSSFTAKDKAEYEKRYIDELNRPVLVTSPYVPAPVRQPSPELIRMSLQVAEVLPYVPREVIMRDLSRTRSVDMTISNILEGVVSYTPLTASQQQQLQASAQPLRTLHSSSPSSVNEVVFSKSSQDRMVSFKERKARMIEEARRRYIEKKGLKGLD
ncbi:hypothetical protein O3M35_012230 [Rhynocoris fuscipes]|uniref:Lipid droplet-regulating VLDL assembly factor AUP1 n=1 Tax=Rhynocoris fuscipes TaxID=488301 RepID=A0AAW1CRN4_9HEMI